MEEFELQDIKKKNISSAQLEELRKFVESYESLFNKRAMKYKSSGLNKKDLSGEDFRRLILEEYTFLKRPAILYQSKSYIGNSKKTVESLIQELQNG